jgi:hypothetical protein
MSVSFESCFGAGHVNKKSIPIILCPDRVRSSGINEKSLSLGRGI